MKKDLTITSFPVLSLRKIPCPLGRDKGPEGERQNTYIAVCRVKDLPADIPMDTNPREQNFKTTVARKIRDGLLLNRDQIFHLANRGLLISAGSLSFNNRTNHLTLTFDNLEKHGCVDGGHTYKIILEHRADLEFEQFVRLEITTGVEEYFEELAAARNTSNQVEEKSLAELAGKFDFLKEAIKNTPFEDDIAYKENEPKSIDIREIVAVLTMFKRSTSDGDSQPVIAYSSKAKCVRDFVNDDSEIRKMVDIVPQIFALYDYIEEEFPRAYDGHYGKIKGVGYKEGSRFHQLRFSGGQKPAIAHETPKGFIYPILAAMRAIVEEDPIMGKYYWQTDPFHFFERVKKQLVNATVERSRSLGNNPQSVGKDSGHWREMYNQVKIVYLEEFASLKKTS